MAVEFLNVRNISISKKKVPLPSRFFRLWSVLPREGPISQNAAVELHMHATKPKECGATSLSSSSKNQLARIVHKASLSWRGASDAAEIGDDFSFACRGTSKTPKRRFIRVDVA